MNPGDGVGLADDEGWIELTGGFVVPEDDAANFIRAHFPSVWTLELLLLLRKDRTRRWAVPELVAALRASELVVSRGLDHLLAGGLVMMEHPSDVRYAPIADELDDRVGQVDAMYATRPDAVRRLIISGTNNSLSAFADAFRFKQP